MSADTPIGSRTLIRGGIFGMIAGAVMAMSAIVASATYQSHGFFTLLFHISARFGSPDPDGHPSREQRGVKAADETPRQRADRAPFLVSGSLGALTSDGAIEKHAA